MKAFEKQNYAHKDGEYVSADDSITSSWNFVLRYKMKKIKKKSRSVKTLKEFKETMIFVEFDGFSWMWLTKWSEWTSLELFETQHSAQQNRE